MGLSGGAATGAPARRPVGVVGALVAVLAVLAGALAGCTNTPPPPLVSSPVARTSPSRTPALNQLVVGVDSVAGGYNPHTLADQSTVTTALSSLLLPSVFRPAPDGTPRLDPTLMVSAQVTKANPYTVSYVLRRDASWSDSAPIAAEDFVYLWQRMRGEPGVVDPAGYRLISGIASRDGGKTVEVTFARPYPGWRSLFSGLLPAHLLKDAPGGWPSALSDGFPATGGPMSVRSLDKDRGEIVLERNDRYWEKPVALDRVVLRKADRGPMVDALRNGDDQAVLLRADAIATNMLSELAKSTPVTTTSVPRPEVARVVLRPASPRLTDIRVRAAVQAAIDRESLIATGSGNGPSAQLKAGSLVVPPTAPGYAASLPAGAPPAVVDLATTERLLTQAGYAKQDNQWVKDGHPLSLVVAAPAGREPYPTLATQVQHQLAAAGIGAKVRLVAADELFGQTLAQPVNDKGVEGDDAVDVLLAPQVDTGDPATVLASTFGCRANLPDGGPQPPANLSGYCDPTLQPTIDAALSGDVLLSDALARVEPVLWQEAVSIPLFQTADVLSSRPEVSGVDSGAPFAGPFSGAPNWRRPNR